MRPTEPSPHPPRRVLAVVALAATAVRLLYLALHARSVFFTVPVLDARHFDAFARALSDGTVPTALATGFRATLYPLLLAPLYRLAGDLGIVAAQVVQHGAGVATAVLVAALARRLFADDRAALFAGLLFAVAPVPLFFEGELLVESLFVVTLAALLFSGASATAAETDLQAHRQMLATGALLALATQLRPNAWLLLAALPWATPPRHRTRSVGLGLAAFALTTTVFAVAQAPLTAGFRLLPSAGGVNLFLGNRRGADGLVPRHELAVTHDDAYRDSVEAYAERAQARAADAGSLAASTSPRRYWLTRTWRELAADPLGRLALLGRKAIVTLWNGEVPNNRDFAFAAREETPLLAWLPARFGLLLALGVVGWSVAPRRPARPWLLAVAALHALGVVLFFVADRYRLPLYVPCAVLAGGGVAALLDAALSREHHRFLRLAALATGVAALGFVDWTGARRSLPGAERDLYFRSIARAETGDAVGAIEDARRATSLRPGDPYLHLQIGVAAMAADRLGEAGPAIARARELAPREPRIHNALGVLSERLGRPFEADQAYRAALSVSPTFAPALANAAWRALLGGRENEARERLAALPPREAEHPRMLLLRAELARRGGDPATDTRLRAAARAKDPEGVARLEWELTTAAAVLGPAASESAASRR